MQKETKIHSVLTPFEGFNGIRTTFYGTTVAELESSKGLHVLMTQGMLEARIDALMAAGQSCDMELAAMDAIQEHNSIKRLGNFSIMYLGQREPN